MQCLHCGKELALFKRLTKGEFCSEDHRQAYQREYSQMALSRLLQAKPPGEKSEKEKAEKERLEKERPEKETAETKAMGKRWNAGSAPISLGLSDSPAPASSEPSEGPIKEAGRMAGRDAGKLPDSAAQNGAEAKGSSGAGRTTPEATAKISLKIAKTGEEKPAKATFAEKSATTSRKEPFQVEKSGSIQSPAPAAGQGSAQSASQNAGQNKDARRNLAEETAPAYGDALETEAAPSRKAAEETVLKPASAREKTLEKTAAAEAQAPSPMAKGIADLPASYPGKIPEAKIIAPELALAQAAPDVPGHKLTPRTANFPWGGRVRVPTGGDPGKGKLRSAGRHAENDGDAVEFTRTASLGQLHAALADVEAPAPALNTVEVPASARRAAPCLSFWHTEEVSFTGFSVAVGELARLRLPTAEADDAERRRTKVRTSATKASDVLLAQSGKVPSTETDRRDATLRNTADIYAGAAGSEAVSDDELARKPRTGAEAIAQQAEDSGQHADASQGEPVQSPVNETPDSPHFTAETTNESELGPSSDSLEDREMTGLVGNAPDQPESDRGESAQSDTGADQEAHSSGEEAHPSGFDPAQLAHAISSESAASSEEAGESDAPHVAALPARRPVIKIMRSKQGGKQDLAGVQAVNGDVLGGKFKAR